MSVSYKERRAPFPKTQLLATVTGFLGPWVWQAFKDVVGESDFIAGFNSFCSGQNDDRRVWGQLMTSPTKVEFSPYLLPFLSTNVFHRKLKYFTGHPVTAWTYYSRRGTFAEGTDSRKFVQRHYEVVQRGMSADTAAVAYILSSHGQMQDRMKDATPLEVVSTISLRKKLRRLGLSGQGISPIDLAIQSLQGTVPSEIIAAGREHDAYLRDGC